MKEVQLEHRLTKMEENVKRLPGIERSVRRIEKKIAKLAKEDHEERIKRLEAIKLKAIGAMMVIVFFSSYIWDFVKSKF